MKPPTPGASDKTWIIHAAVAEAVAAGKHRDDNAHAGCWLRLDIIDLKAAIRRAIDAAIAAERERIAAFCEANHTKYGDQLAAAIRERGNA